MSEYDDEGGGGIPGWLIFFLIFMLEPISYWRKTPFWLSTIFAFFLFDTVYLNPVKQNDFYMQPEHPD